MLHHYLRAHMHRHSLLLACKQTPQTETFAGVLSDSSLRPVICLLQVPLLAPLSPGQRSDLCTALKPRMFNAGESIVRKGEPGQAFYIVESGTCIVLGASGQVSICTGCTIV